MKRRKERKVKLSPDVIEKAKKLQERNGIPFAMAVKIALGQTTLADVLKAMMRKEKIRNIVTKHGLSPELAGHVVDRRISLDAALLKSRVSQHKKENWKRSVLEDVFKDNRKITLMVDPDVPLSGRVTKLDKYDFEFMVEGESAPRAMRKIDVKYAFAPELGDAVKAIVGVDLEVKSKNLAPAPSPLERKHIKHVIFQELLDSGRKFTVTTRRGDILCGRLDWYGLYEFGMRLDDEIHVTVFRHAVEKLTT